MILLNFVKFNAYIFFYIKNTVRKMAQKVGIMVHRITTLPTQLTERWSQVHVYSQNVED